MTGLFQLAREAFARELEKFRNRRFLEATMAAAALMATADGEVGLTERDMMDQALESIHELNIYDPHDAIDLYLSYVDGLAEDPAGTRARILEQVRALAEDSHAARLLLRVCVAIARSDADFSDREEAVIDALCRALALERSAAGL